MVENCCFLFLKLSSYVLGIKLNILPYVPPETEENGDSTDFNAEPGSGSDSGSGEILTKEDQEMRRILDLQTSIPYKKRKTKSCY